MFFLNHSPSTEYRPPPPAVVLSWQLEVGQGHRDAGCDAEQDGVDNEEDAVQSVLFAAPQRGEDVVQFHGNGAEK